MPTSLRSGAFGILYPMQAEPLRAREVPSWTWLLLPLVLSAAARDFWAPDEPRYAQVAREAFESGGLLVMHLCGEVYPDKPPLLFWIAGLLGRLSGWSEPAMRLVSLVACAVTAWLVARLARRWWGAPEACLAPALFLGTVMVTEIGGRLQIDPLLAVLTTGALALLAGPADEGRAATRRWLGAGALAGLAALAKGPVAFACVGFVMVAWRFAKLPAPSLRPAVALGALALAVLPVLAWALAAVAVEPALGRELFYGQHLDRVVSADRHPGPPWKHLWRMPLLLLPWTAPVVLGLARAWRGARAPDRDEGLLRAALWLGTLLLFFSLIPPKRDLYLLPAYPAAALCGARWLARAARVPAWIPRLSGSLLVVAGAGALVAPLVPIPQVRELGLAWRGPLVALPFLAGGALCLARARSERAGWIRAQLLAWSVGGALAFALIGARMNAWKSPRALAERLAARAERPAEIPCHGVNPEGYRFYGGVPAVGGGSLGAALERDGEDFLALVRDREWERLDEGLRARLRVLDEDRVGSRRVLVLGARPGAVGRSPVLFRPAGTAR